MKRGRTFFFSSTFPKCRNPRGEKGERNSYKIFITMLYLQKLIWNVFALFFVRCQSKIEADVEGSKLGIVREDVQDFVGGNFKPAPGVETICLFPKNSAKLATAGEKTELLVGMENAGESPLNIIAIEASVHLPFDHRMPVQNLTTQVFDNASVPPSTQAIFPYIFAVSKFLQPGTFDLVGTVVYEINQSPYQSTFYNGTIEVVKAGGFFSVELVFLVTLGISLLVLLGLWIHGQFKRISQKTKVAPKVEVGTGTNDASMDEWLQDWSLHNP